MRFLYSFVPCLIVAGPSFGQDQQPNPEEKSPAAAPPVALEVGDILPPVALEDLTQSQARSFSDFYGRAVLLEFFAHWCAPCAQTVPHLNELQAKYGPRGLSVVGVTTDNGKKTLPWIEKHGVEYAWGRDTSGALHQMFQIKSIPAAVLIDAFGTVAWTGDPRRLKEETLEAVLPDTLERPTWDWPEDARPLVGFLERAELATALQEAEKLSAREGFDPQALVRGRIAKLVARFDGLVDDANYLRAFELGERLDKGLSGLPEGTKLSARLEELRSDPEIARRVSEEKSIDLLEARAGALRKAAEAEVLRTDVAAFLDSKPGEEFERRAKILLDMLDRGLAKAKKRS